MTLEKFKTQKGSLNILVIIIILVLLSILSVFVFDFKPVKDLVFPEKVPESIREFSSKATITPESMPGEIIIKFRSLVSEDKKQKLLTTYGITVKSEITKLNIVVGVVPEESLDKVIEVLKNDPRIEYAESNYLGKSDATPNDTLYSNQWGLPKILAPAAWDLQKGSSSIVVAVIDDGIDSNHLDLAGKIVPGWNVAGNNSDTSDITGHGTPVSGIIGAATNNNRGIAGLGWNVSIMPIRATNQANGSKTTADIISAIYFAVDHGAKVINLSQEGFGGSAMEAAVNYAYSNGVVYVASSGNNLSTISPAAAFANAIAVGATDQNDLKANFSTGGPQLDVMAPGVNIHTTINGGTYGGWNGTSFAAPFVSALAALIFSSNPALSVQQVADIIRNTSDDMGVSGFDDQTGCGRINAEQAIKVAIGSLAPLNRPAPCAYTISESDTQPPTSSITSPPNNSTVFGTFTLQASANDNVGVTKLDWYFNGTYVWSDMDLPFEWTIDTAGIGLPNGTYTFTAKAFDAANNMTESAPLVITVNNSAPDTTLPNVSITSPTQNQQASDTLSITSNASDNVAVSKVVFKIDGAFISEDASAPYTASLDTTLYPNGSYQIQASAVDTSGNSSTDAVTINIINGLCPEGSNVSFIQPTSGATISGDYTFTASANHPSGVTKVEFYVDGVLFGEDTTSPYQVLGQTSFLTNGQHSFSLKAYNSQGQKNQPPPISVTIAN